MSTLFALLSSFLNLFKLCWLIAFRSCMPLSNCINLRSHIKQRLFKTHPYSASCIVGNASGRCNQSHWSERKSSSFIGHTLYSASLHYPFPILPFLSPFLFFPISSSLPFRNIHLILFSSKPPAANVIFFFFFWCHKSEDRRFLPFSHPVALNKQNGPKMPLFQNLSGLWFFQLCYYKTVNG